MAPAPGDIITLDPNEIDLREEERLRPIDLRWAEAIGASMRRDGQINPVHVYAQPKGGWALAGPGAHRVTGARMAEIAIDAKVVSPDTDSHRRREAAENLFRRSNDPYERAEAVAELVRLQKLRVGIDPDRPGGAASAEHRWKKALKNEAVDANATIAFAYGWSDAVAEQLGLSRRTVEYDLLLYRRIPRSLIERLRQARHPILGNAAQLRALAKLERDEQISVVALLCPTSGDQLTQSAKSVSEALARLRGKRADPADKRFSAVIGALSRMSAAERIGLFQSPLFHDQIPAEARRLLAPMLRDGPADVDD
ncbi:MAG: ParB/RepB/Spo0J family partition protein [Pseudomonadota bacterium]